MIKPDVLGSVDLASGALLLYTTSAIPVMFADAHAGFLIIKGIISHFRLPGPMMPIFTLGIAADIISAAILFTGSPPFIGSLKYILAGALLLKGLWSLGFKFSA